MLDKLVPAGVHPLPVDRPLQIALERHPTLGLEAIEFDHPGNRLHTGQSVVERLLGDALFDRRLLEFGEPGGKVLRRQRVETAGHEPGHDKTGR